MLLLKVLLLVAVLAVIGLLVVAGIYLWDRYATPYEDEHDYHSTKKRRRRMYNRPKS